MPRSLIVLMLGLGGCVEAPTWFDDCDCGDDICVEDVDGRACAEVPKACKAAFADRCDPDAWGEACVVALCGDFVGEWEFSMDCHVGGGSLRKFADCTGVPDTSSTSGD